MRGKRLEIDWREDADGLMGRYKREKNPELRTRLHGLWLMRTGNSISQVSQTLGVHYRTVQDWAAWYRTGGVEEVTRRRRGGGRGRPKKITSEQEALLIRRAREGSFFTMGEARAWIEETWGVSYTCQGMYSLFRRLKIKKKVPRPAGEKASEEAQEAWKKGGLWMP